MFVNFVGYVSCLFSTSFNVVLSFVHHVLLSFTNQLCNL